MILFSGQELLKEELNRRFLDIQSHPPPGGASPTLNSGGGQGQQQPPFNRGGDIHQHQHQHMHQHQHTHQHMYPIPFSGSLGPPPAPLLVSCTTHVSHPILRVPRATASPIVGKLHNTCIPSHSWVPRATSSPVVGKLHNTPINTCIPSHSRGP